MPADVIVPGYAVLRITLGLVFLVSALTKLRAPQQFVEGVVDYQVLPTALARLYGRLLPPVELGVGFLLAAGTALPIASVVAILLLISFGLAMGINTARGRRLDCHCFGAAAAVPVGWAAIGRDAFFLALAVPVTWTSFAGGLATGSFWFTPTILAEAASALVAVLLYFLIEQWAVLIHVNNTTSSLSGATRTSTPADNGRA
jgi:uncharacterized membrane protein YphA (DoxX/SURF4 family)